MPSFAYSARDAAGELREGTIQAASASAAADEVIASGRQPISIKAAKGSAGSPGAGIASAPIKIPFLKTKEQIIKPEEILLFSRQLHSLLKAGVPITTALSGLQNGAEPGLALALRTTRESLESGAELSASMAKRPDVFSSFFVSMIRVGETTGKLDEVFLRLFHHLSFEKFMREQVKSALRYPSFVVIAMALAIGVINLFVIPAFQKVFDGFGAELPLMTRILVGFSKATVAGWPYALVAGGIGTYFFKAWQRSPAGRLKWDSMKLKFPIAGPIIRKATLARFARSLALALKSGLPVVQALNLVAGTVENAYFTAAVEKMRDAVERGETVSRTATASRVFTNIVLQMISIGEESGTLDEMLGEVAEFYQQDVEYELKTISSKIEPILIVFLGGLVMVLALGVFLPIWDLGHVALKR